MKTPEDPQNTHTAPVLELRPREMDIELVQTLEALLHAAQAGGLLGLVVLTNDAGRVNAVSVGQFTKGEVLLAMEYWKREHLPNL